MDALLSRGLRRLQFTYSLGRKMENSLQAIVQKTLYAIIQNRDF